MNIVIILTQQESAAFRKYCMNCSKRCNLDGSAAITSFANEYYISIHPAKIGDAIKILTAVQGLYHFEFKKFEFAEIAKKIK